MNPFLINNYIEPEYFCDRENETKTLLSNIKNQSNTVFFAQRRLGKTALVQHAFYLLKKKSTNCIYLDIYPTQNLKDFTSSLANSIYQVFPEKNIGKRFMETIKALRPVISFNELSGSPELSLDIAQEQEIGKTIPQLLHFLDNQNTKTVIAIDEFQQILNYPEKNVEALLRSVIQQLKNVCFIFCGSSQKIMHDIFNSAKRPFYASTRNINLQKIDRQIYAQFIRRHFEKNKMRISEEAVELILDLTVNHTYYTQHLSHEVFSFGQKTIDATTIRQALKKILIENEGIYFQYRNLITYTQWNLLKAIAAEEKVIKPYSREFIYKYRLGTPAGVKRALESLMDKEMIFYATTMESPYYEVQDKFLMRWMQYV